MTLNVHLVPEYGSPIITHLNEQIEPDIRLTTGDVLPPAGDIHILIAGHPDRDQIEANRDLHTLIVPWTGIPLETRQLAGEFPHIALHNLHHNAAPVAEMAVALLLAAAKKVVPFDAALRQGDWSLRYLEPVSSQTLKDKTALILGYGEIGRRIARICSSLDMRVWAIKRKVSPGTKDPFVQGIFPPDYLYKLLPSTNALLVALPLTPLTENLIGEQELDLMPSESIIVNIGRALIIDEEALYNVLNNGRIGGAGLDVWYNYPPDEVSRSSTYPSNYPFWDLENVVLSPHRAGLTNDINYLRMDHLSVLLNAAARGEKIPNKVDLHLGY